MDLGAAHVGCRVAKSAFFPHNWVDFTFITSFFFSSVSENLYFERLLLHMLTDVLSDEFT